MKYTIEQVMPKFKDMHFTQIPVGSWFTPQSPVGSDERYESLYLKISATEAFSFYTRKTYQYRPFSTFDTNYFILEFKEPVAFVPVLV
jgi:hypothetical protein